MPCAGRTIVRADRETAAAETGGESGVFVLAYFAGPVVQNDEIVPGPLHFCKLHRMHLFACHSSKSSAWSVCTMRPVGVAPKSFP